MSIRMNMIGYGYGCRHRSMRLLMYFNKLLLDKGNHVAMATIWREGPVARSITEAVLKGGKDTCELQKDFKIEVYIWLFHCFTGKCHKLSYKRKLKNCTICQTPQSKLARHLKSVHRDDDAVVRIVNLQHSQQGWEFAILRNKGMLDANKQKAMDSDGEMEPIKPRLSSSTDVVQFSVWKGAFQRKYSYRQKICQVGEACPMQPELCYVGEESVHRISETSIIFQDQWSWHIVQTRQHHSRNWWASVPEKQAQDR